MNTQLLYFIFVSDNTKFDIARTASREVSPSALRHKVWYLKLEIQPS